MQIEITHYSGRVLTIYDDWEYDFDGTDAMHDRIQEQILINRNAHGYEGGVPEADDPDDEVLGEFSVEHPTEYKFRTIARNLMRDGRFTEFTIYE
jgi:hypothetical protein